MLIKENPFRLEHYNMRDQLTEAKKMEILEEVFFRKHGYHPNMDNPQTFSEKIMWLKLYYQDPLITTCSDKFAVKDYVTEHIGEQYIVPTIASWENPRDIDFDALPDKFVLKVNWSSGYNIIVKDKSKIDKEEIIEQLEMWMRPASNSYYEFFNWGYKHMKPVIYAEEYIEQVAGQVYDYKFYICNGKFEYMFIATERTTTGVTYTFFDKELKHLPFIYGHKPNANPLPKMPVNVQKMIELAEKLAKPFPFVRVDFYEIDPQTIYVGEMTFYSGGGILKLEPRKYDYILGSKLELPEKKIIDSDPIPAAPSRGFAGSVKHALGAVAGKFVGKLKVGKSKYIRVLGLRIPYETHIEIVGENTNKYIRLLGVEFCYKHLDYVVRGANCRFVYTPNTPLEAFLMEDKITDDIKRIHCEQKGYKQLGYFPNLKNPKSFNEKIMWLAINYKNPEICVAADKGKAKKWIADRIGEEYLIPLLGVYDDVNDIDFNKLPRQFVFKLNDGWGADQVMVVTDKHKLNIDAVKAILSSWLYPWKNYYYQNMCILDEKMEKPTIIAEQYVKQSDSDVLDDYKFYCCNGEPKFALIVTGRGSRNQQRSFVNMNWEVLPFVRNGKGSSDTPRKPVNLEKMKELCRALSKDVPLVRVDFYEVDGKLYVGEMTFTPGMFLRYRPRTWDFELGNYLDIKPLMRAKELEKAGK